MTGHVIVARQFDDPGQQRRAADLGIWVFLASEMLFFGALYAELAMLMAIFGGAKHAKTQKATARAASSTRRR